MNRISWSSVPWPRSTAATRGCEEPESWLPPHATGTPQGLAVDAQGTLYYAALDLRLCHQASGGRISTSSAPSPQRETAFTTSHPW